MSENVLLRKPALKKSKGAVIIADAISGIETAILAEIQHGGAVPHQRILSRQKLARLLGASPYRIQMAVDRLEQRGLVYARKGSGVYLAEKAFGANKGDISMPAADKAVAKESFAANAFMTINHVPIFKTLRVQVQGGFEDDEVQVHMWRQVFDAFNREFPFVNLEVDFGGPKPDAPHDVIIKCLDAFGDDLPEQMPLDVKILAQGGFDPNAFVRHIFDQGRALPAKELFALPLIRTTTILAVNHRLFHQHGLEAGPFTHPGDWFRVGFALAEKSGGRLHGFNYAGFHFHGKFYGIDLREQDGRWTFERVRMAKFLEETKPCIRRDQLAIKWSMNQFFDESLGSCYASLYTHPWITKHMGKTAHYVPLPLEPDGFVEESSFLGAVPQASSCIEEATLLLGFIASEKGQAAMLAEHPEWLSVNRVILERQKASSPYPEGSVLYEYDPRSVRSQRYPHRSFILHRAHMETEAAKFFLGLQGLEKTMDKMAGKKLSDLAIQ